MTDSQQRPTIKFIYRKEDFAGSTKQPRRVADSLAPEMVGLKFNSWEIISTKVERLYKRQELAIHVKCKCGAEKVILAANFRSGKSKMCKRCTSQARHERDGHAVISGAAMKRVQKRCNDMRQRCKNQNAKSYKNYGARGIEFRFASVAEAIAYVLKELPHSTYLKLDIDRIDNNGHYEPGNLRLVTRTTNLRNRSITKFVEYKGKKIPMAHIYHVVRTLWPDVRYTDQTMRNLVFMKNFTLEEIRDRYRNLRSCKPKGRTILPTPDPDIASLYLTA